MPIQPGQLRTLNIETTDAYLQGLQAAPPLLWPRVAQEIPMTTNTMEAPILGMVKPLREWVGPRMIQHLGAEKYSITTKKFEDTIGIPRDDVEDDNIGLYMPQIRDLAQQVVAWPDQQVFAKLAKGFVDLCYDKKPFFSATHPDGNGGVFSNQDLAAGQGSGVTQPTWYLLDTSRSVRPLVWCPRTAPEYQNLWSLDDPNVFFHDEFLSGVRARGVADYGFPMFAYAIRGGLNATTFDAAMTAMQSYTNAVGEPMGINPNLAIVPPALRAAAEQLWDTQLTALTVKNVAGDQNVAAATVNNTKYKAIQWFVAPRLSGAANTTTVV